ncbi:MAG: lytic murein transglycosylase [Candidatus Zambryskibacteria bacterium]|nr:lytic murein transglycosylase [Candidatus Zambryskibacteria bacterium]
MKRRFFLLFFIFLSLFPVGIGAITQDEQEAIWREELAQTEIKQRNIAIAKLDVSIKEKSATIVGLEAQIEKGHESLAQLLRKTNEIDEFSLVEVILSDQNISDFFSDVDSFQTIKRSLAELFVKIRDTQDLTEKEKAALAKQQDTQLDQKAAMAIEQKKVQTDEQQKQYLIQLNKTQEKTYEQVLAERQAKAAEIKSKLFRLAGGSAAIPFGTALTYAQNASSKTGVSPAFLLAILTQESNLGANVGKCYLTDATTGAGVNIDSGKVWTNLMKASRDVQPFMEITNRLGFNAFKTVVSCPIAGVSGYGGAMGPAQFIASTWQLFEDRLKDILGHDANPWDAEDAFTASAMYLGDLGAKNGTYSGEIRAACKYYGSGGTNCSYGRSVMGLKNNIQSDIDYLLQYGVSRR